MPDPDLEISVWGGGEGGHPDPDLKGGTRPQKKIFSSLWASFSSKNKRGEEGTGPLGLSPGSATGGAMIWNSLPNSFKEIKSLQLF